MNVKALVLLSISIATQGLLANWFIHTDLHRISIDEFPITKGISSLSIQEISLDTAHSKYTGSAIPNSARLLDICIGYDSNWTSSLVTRIEDLNRTLDLIQDQDKKLPADIIRTIQEFFKSKALL